MKNRLLLLLAALVIALPVLGQDAVIRMVSYNTLNYPGSSGLVRDPLFSVVFEDIEPDLFVAQEVTSPASSVLFLNNVLDPDVWSVSDPTGLGQSDEFLYYKHDMFELVEVTSIQTVLRNIELYEVRLLTLPTEPTLYIANAHLKASSGGTNEQQRLVEVTEFLDYMDDNNLHMQDVIFCGDLNLYGSSEPAYQALLNDGEFEDPIDSPGSWHDNVSFSDVHTQSTRTTSFYGGATGGMDDRFDFMLVQPSFFDGDGWEYMEDSYTAWGNDGNHFNQDINAGTNGAVDPEVADAIYTVSDHVPVVMDIGFYTGAPVTFQLTPAVPNPTIFPSGGVVEYNALIVNNTDQLLQGQAWTAVVLPNGNVISPVQLVNLTMPVGFVGDYDLSLNVPGWAPGGSYTFRANLGHYPNIVALSDQFDFTKLGGAGSFSQLEEAWGMAGMTVASESFDAISSQPTRFALTGVYPNPFNGCTQLALTLPETGEVELTVTDITGRQVMTQRNGTLNAGDHRLRVDLHGQASGMYFASVRSGQQHAVAKLMLVR